MVANGQSRTNSQEDAMTLVSTQDEDFLDLPNARARPAMHDCPHCDFKCDSTTEMTQHSWEQHPLLMRRKKHLINASKPEACDEANAAVLSQRDLVQVTNHDHEMQSCNISSANIANDRDKCDTTVLPNDTSKDYREKAIRSISLLSTAAAILESHSILSQERQVPTAKAQDANIKHPIPAYSFDGVQPFLAPVYRAYVPTLNQYVTIPVDMASISNPGAQNSMKYVQNQHTDVGAPHPPIPLTQSYTYYMNCAPHVSKLKQDAPSKQTSEETRTLLRNLLKTNHQPVTEHQHTTTPSAQTRKPASKASKPGKQSRVKDTKRDVCPLGEVRRKQLEHALLSVDYCDINDSSTTMPFKCSDGVWRMVKFKCIKGVWVVQTPESNTPTVYVPCHENRSQAKATTIIARANGLARHKRKLSDCSEYHSDVKRLCASAPVLTMDENSETPSPTIKRTLSNPSMSKQLPAPSQYFTNNEGKRVNISVVKHCSAPSSCNLIKSLLLRKPSSPAASSPSGSSSISSGDGDLTGCLNAKKDSMIAATLNKTWLKSAIAF